MAGKKGGGTLEVQRDRLKAKLNADQISRAQNMASHEPEMIRYAFKCIEKAHINAGMTKTEERTYEELKEIDVNAAEEWRKKCINRKK